MSEIKRPLKVFLCHAHADRDPVHAFYIRLVKDGVDAWLDKENCCRVRSGIGDPQSCARSGRGCGLPFKTI
ncbi:hypothetical protein [Candidatus Villigracilis proximus]|uniref:hypothetical protein n=1 Tax=Candidatus Villigracilis proximus TaxID=3140683 RepID=UPI0031EB52D1